MGRDAFLSNLLCFAQIKAAPFNESALAVTAGRTGVGEGALTVTTNGTSYLVHALTPWSGPTFEVRSWQHGDR